MSAVSALRVSDKRVPVRPLGLALEAELSVFGVCRQCEIGAGEVILSHYGIPDLPEDRFDRQPICLHDTILVADVRLDNRSDLIRELELSQSEQLADSAILMAAWLRWGSDCLDHLIGGFAFVTWTPATQELFAARDHVGERPLFYTRTPEFVAVSSTVKSLLALPGVSRQIDDERLAAWLIGATPDAASSFFRSIQKVRAGHFIRSRPDGVRCSRYWHPLNAPPIRFRQEDHYAEALREVLDRSTAARLRSQNAVGSLLSSGLDSGAVTTSAALLLGAQGKKLTAFTSVPRPDFIGGAGPGRLADERSGASEICSAYANIEHVLVDSRGTELFPTASSWIDAQCEPPGNLVNKLWFSAILERARARDIRVILEGARGNTTISWSTWSILGALFRKLRWPTLLNRIRSLRERDALSWKTALRYSTRGIVPSSLVRPFLAPGPFAAMPMELISDEWIKRFDVRERIYELVYRRPSDPRKDQGELFEHYDDGSVRLAIEAMTGVVMRDPTADRRIYEFCFGIPQEQYLAGGHTRSLIRRAMLGRLPDSVRLSYARGMQGADWNIGVGEAVPKLRRDIEVFRRSPAVSRAINVEAMQRLLDSWPQTGFERPEVYARWNAALMSAVGAAYFLLAFE